MLESVGDQVPDDDLSKAVYQLIKEGGLTHREIFGFEETVNFVEEVERNGLFGQQLDYVLGRKKVEKTEVVKRRGMPLKTLASYMKLLKEHQEQKEKEQKKAKMKNSMKGQSFG
jgi:predicted transcriptional regulator